MAGEVGKADGIANLAVLIKEWLAQFAIAKPATKSGNLLALGIRVAFGYTTHAFSGYFASDLWLYFYKDKTARILCSIRLIEF